MIFNKEVVSEQLFDEIAPLLLQHYREIAHFQDIELKPDWAAYMRAAEMGNLRVYSARSGEKNLLVGYAVFFVRHNMHYADSLQATQDILFVQKEFRGRGGEFIAWCDYQLKKEGVQAVYQHVKAKHNFGKLLERMGYELVDLIYTKRLDVGE